MKKLSNFEAEFKKSVAHKKKHIKKVKLKKVLTIPQESGIHTA